MEQQNRLRYVDTDRNLFKDGIGKNVTAAFLYSKNVLKDGKIIKYSAGVRTVAYGGKLYLPSEFFVRFMNASFDDNMLILGDKCYPCGDFCKKKNGETYVPASEACEALGICARIYDGKLIVVAGIAVLDLLSNNSALLNSAKYGVMGEYSTAHLTSVDFTEIKNKWRAVLYGDARTNDITDPDVRQKLEDMTRSARKAQAELNREEGRAILFGEKAPEASADLTTQYRRIREMAEGYAAYGAESYHDERLLRDILDSLRWMYENMYGEAITECRGWRDAHDFNWWDWFVGGPIGLVKTMLAVEDHLTMEEKQKYLKCYKWVRTIHRVGYRPDFASSRIMVGVPAALLLEDKELLYDEFLDYDLLLEESDPEKGKYADLCCWTHGYPYNMMYGFCAIDRTFFTGAVLAGTAAEFNSPKVYGMFDLVKYMYEAACYKGQGFVIFNGRANMGTEFNSGATIITKTLPMIGYFGEDEDRHLKKMIKRFCSDPDIIKMAKRVCSLYDLATLNSILNDDSISSENDYDVTYAWFTADRIAHHRNDAAFMLAMSSERHPSYESINSANRRGWYTGDGALYFYTNTDRHSFDGANFITNPDITKRIPGTTTDDREMKEWAYRSGWRSPKAFAGCMDMYGQFGMGAFEYSAYHYDGHEADGTADDGYGGGFVYYENDLEAKKSYFFFDEEVVCLGAGINSTMHSPVRTTVEHRRLVKPEGEKIIIDGKLMPAEEFASISECGLVYIEGFAGYVFPNGGEIETRRYLRRESTKTDQYFSKSDEGNPQYCTEINILHGEDPIEEQYVYAILPYASAESTKAYSLSPRVEILENSSCAQVVRKPSLNITMMAIYKAGEYFGVITDIPALVMLGQRDGLKTFSVCDPTQKKERGVFVIKGRYELVSAYPEMDIKIENDRVVITADLTDLAGKNLIAEFKEK